MSADPPARLTQLVGTLVARDRWSREDLLEHQAAALDDVVRHAVARSPYYREALGRDAARGGVRLENLPSLPKSTLMEEWDRVVTDPRLRLREVERRLAGPPDGARYLDEYLVCETGGSTGARGVFVYGQPELEAVMAGMLRALALLGIDSRTRLVSIGSPSPLHLSNQVFAAFRAGRSGSPPLTVTMPLGQIVEALNAYRPEAMTTYPTLAGMLADEQLAGRLDIRPRILVTGSEVLSEDVRSRAREAWGAEMYDVYVTTEAGMMATECREHCGRHVWEDQVILEVVDEQNRPVAPGVPGARVLLTNLWNRTQPLIRYELEDAVTLAAGANPAGRPFARIAAVDGRSADILHLPARGGGDVAVHPLRLREPFARLPHVRQFQLACEADGVRVQVVLDDAAPRETPAAVRSALVEALEAAGAVPPQVVVEPVGEIERTGSGAKLTLVRSKARETEPALAR